MYAAGLWVDVLPGDDRGCDLVEPPLAVHFAVEVLGVLLAGLIPVTCPPPAVRAFGDAGHRGLLHALADDQGLLVVGGADALQRCGEGLAYAMKAFLKILQFVLKVLQLTPHLCTPGPERGVFDHQSLQLCSTLQRDLTLGLDKIGQRNVEGLGKGGELIEPDRPCRALSFGNRALRPLLITTGHARCEFGLGPPSAHPTRTQSFPDPFLGGAGTGGRQGRPGWPRPLPNEDRGRTYRAGLLLAIILHKR